MRRLSVASLAEKESVFAEFQIVSEPPRLPYAFRYPTQLAFPPTGNHGAIRRRARTSCAAGVELRVDDLVALHALEVHDCVPVPGQTGDGRRERDS